MWNPFRRERRIFNLCVNGIKPGDVVRHKISHDRFVVSAFIQVDDEWWVRGATGIWYEDDHDLPLCELELEPRKETISVADAVALTAPATEH